MADQSKSKIQPELVKLLGWIVIVAGCAIVLDILFGVANSFGVPWMILTGLLLVAAVIMWSRARWMDIPEMTYYVFRSPYFSRAPEGEKINVVRSLLEILSDPLRWDEDFLDNKDRQKELVSEPKLREKIRKRLTQKRTRRGASSSERLRTELTHSAILGFVNEQIDDMYRGFTVYGPGLALVFEGIIHKFVGRCSTRTWKKDTLPFKVTARGVSATQDYRPTTGITHALRACIQFTADAAGDLRNAIEQYITARLNSRLSIVASSISVDRLVEMDQRAYKALFLRPGHYSDIPGACIEDVVSVLKKLKEKSENERTSLKARRTVGVTDPHLEKLIEERETRDEKIGDAMEQLEKWWIEEHIERKQVAEGHRMAMFHLSESMQADLQWTSKRRLKKMKMEAESGEKFVPHFFYFLDQRWERFGVSRVRNEAHFRDLNDELLFYGCGLFEFDPQPTTYSDALQAAEEARFAAEKHKVATITDAEASAAYIDRTGVSPNVREVAQAVTLALRAFLKGK